MSITTCTVTGNVKSLLNSAVTNCNLKVSAAVPFFHGSTWISGELASVTTDANGSFSVGVVETTTPGQRLNFTFEYYDGVSDRRRKTYWVVIPNQSSALLSDLVATATAVVTTATFPASSVTLTAITGITATDVQSAVSELYTDITTISGAAINRLTGDVTATGPGTVAATIAAGAVTNAKIVAAAGISVNKLAALTASRAVASDSSGFLTSSATTATELGYVNGVTSAIQTQMNTKTTYTANQYGVVLSGSGITMSVLAPDSSTSKVLVSGGASANPSWATVSVAGGGTGIASGTSGGIPYFSGSTTIASSGALTASQLVLGGGAGAAPTPLAAGTQYQVLTMGASNPGYGAVNLAQSAAVTGILPNANTTAASANTASAIVARDGSGNFTAGTVTAALTGTASGNTTYTANQYGVVLSGSANAMSVLAPDSSTAKALISGGSSANPSWAVVGVAGGGTGIASGTSGGVPYFSGTTSIASSGALTASQVVLGGGAGSAPTSLAAGSQYQVLRMGATTPAYGSINLDQSAAVTGTLPNANTTGTAAATASTLMLRDAQGNVKAINFNEGYTTTAMADGTTTLTNASTYEQFFTHTGGTTAQTVQLPDATTLVTGWQFWIANRTTGTGNVTVKDGGGSTTIQTLVPGSQALFTCTGIASAAGTWDATYAVNNAGAGTVTSVAATVPAFLSVAGSPITTTGTLALTLSGTALPTANGGTSITSAGSAGNALVSDGTNWTSAGLSYARQLKNVGLAGTVGSSALTVALKQADGSTNGSATAPILISVRNPTLATGTYNQRSVTGALSQVISSTTTLGMPPSQSNALWVYYIDSDGAGTSKLGVSSVMVDDQQLQSTVAESFTGTVTIAAPGVWTANGHGLNNSDQVTLTTSGALPTGLTTAKSYYVVQKAANSFQLATVPGGTGITTTGTQSGTHTIHVACPRIVSDAVYTSVAVRLIGRMAINNSTMGTWTAPTEISVGGRECFSDPIRFKWSLNTAMSIAGADAGTTLLMDTMAADSHGLYYVQGYTNNVTGYFVAPLTGTYNLNIQAQSASVTTWVAGEDWALQIQINGSNKDTNIALIETATTAAQTAALHTQVALTAGDYVRVDCYNGHASAVNTAASGTNRCYMGVDFYRG